MAVNTQGFGILLATGGFSLEANTIFESYSLALAYALSSASYVGKLISVTSGAEAGAYFVEAIGEGAKLKKVGSDINLSNYVTKDQLVNIYTYKGTKTFEELPIVDNAVGDVYNISNAFELDDESYPAGTNVVWNGSDWDPQAGSVDLSAYATVEALQAQNQSLSAGIAGVSGQIEGVNAEIEGLKARPIISVEQIALIATNASEIESLKGVDARYNERLASIEGMFKDGETNIDLSQLTSSILNHEERIGNVETNKAAKSDLVALQGTVNGLDTRLLAAEAANAQQTTDISNLSTKVTNIETAHGLAITSLSTTVEEHTTSLLKVNEDLVAETQARETAVAGAKTYAEEQAGAALAAAKTYVGEELGKLEYDAAGSAAAVDAKLTAEVSRAQGKEAELLEAINVEKGRLDVFLSSADTTEKAVDTLVEIQEYIDAHGDAVATMLENIGANAAAAKKAQDEVDALELVVASMEEAYIAADQLILLEAKGHVNTELAKLGTAAYADVAQFATAAQGALAVTAAQQANTYTKQEVNDKVTAEITSALSWENVE